MVSHICVGTPLLGWFEADVKRIIAYVLVSLMMTVACTSIFTLIAMLCSNKAYSVAGCILLIFFLLFMGIRITSALNGQVDYMYGEALYKPEMKEEYHILICKMRLGKPVQANGCLSYRDLGIWQEHLFLRIMPKSVILSSQHREAETVGGLPSRRRVFSHDYIFRIVSILFIARRCHQSGNSDWT